MVAWNKQHKALNKCYNLDSRIIMVFKGLRHKIVGLNVNDYWLR